MLRKTLFYLLLLILLTGCIDYDPQSLTIAINPGVDTVEVNSTFIDAGAKSTLGGENYSLTIIDNTVDITKVGTYIIIYEATYKDVKVSAKRIINVIDETAPTITLKPGVDTILQYETWVDAGVNVSDNSNLDVLITKQGDVTNTAVGEYQIVYIATDAYQNQASVIRYVNVLALS